MMPFCLAWFRRPDPDGHRAIDAVTDAWLGGLSVGRHARRFAGGAAGLVADAPIVARGEDHLAFRVDATEGAPLSALFGRDEEAVGAWEAPFLGLLVRGDGDALELYRGAMGQFPLYFQDNGQLLLACSDIDTLLRRPGWHGRLDRHAACHYLAFGIPGPGRTLEAGTRSLPAAHALDIRRRGGPHVRRYWSPLSVPGTKVLDAETQRGLQGILDDSIGRSVESSTALLLSGGIDSGYIAHALGDAGLADRVDAYTIRFTTAGVPHECDNASRTAAAAGLRHRAVPMSAGDATRQLSQVLASGQPRSAWSTLTHAHLMETIGEAGHGRLLSGLGADEVFGGYSHYLKAYRRFWTHLEDRDDGDYEACLDDVLGREDLAGPTLFTGVPRFLDDVAMAQGAGPTLAGWTHAGDSIRFYREAREIRPRAHLFELMVAHECHHRVPDLLLTGFDADTRGSSVTLRYPFLSPLVAGTASRLGATERFAEVGDGWKNKIALRRIAATRVPDEVFQRTPMTFGAPFLAWLAEPGFRSVIEGVLEEGAWPHDVLDREWVMATYRHTLSLDPAGTPASDAERLWAVVTLLAWYRTWIENKEIAR